MLSRTVLVAAVVFGLVTGCSGGDDSAEPAPATDESDEADGGDTVVRVGGPSAPGDTKVALVASADDHSDEPFGVLDADDEVVFSGTLEGVGDWEPWAYVARADFSEVTTAGVYRLRVGDVESEPWEVRADATGEPIATLLEYFAAQRDGNEPSPLHGPAHLNDALLAGTPVDLTGGWMDAGDMLHFTETTAYATVVLQLAARVDPANADALNAEADVGIRWLRKAHPAPDVFVGQVGEEVDHDVGFRAPEDDDGSGIDGIAQRVANSSDGASLAGKAAAALALAAARAPVEERDVLMVAAEEWYAAGLASDSAGPELPGGFYRATTWNDDLALAAVMLHRATNHPWYLVDAMDLLFGHDIEDASWDDVGALVGAEMCGALGSPPVTDVAGLEGGCAALAGAAGLAQEFADSTPWGTPGPFGWGHTAPHAGFGAVVALAERAGLDVDHEIPARARDFLFGANPWGASFVVGFGAEPAQQPHHWAARDGDAQPVGAVVGGPAPMESIAAEGFAVDGPYDSEEAAYEDSVENYVTSEPTITYTANAILLLALLAGDAAE